LPQHKGRFVPIVPHPGQWYRSMPDLGLIDPNNYYQDISIVLHEVLHNVTGMTDDMIQSALGLSTNAVSDNITQRLLKDCF